MSPLMAFTALSNQTKLTAEALADLETPSDVQISPNGSQVAYCLTPSTKKHDHVLSSLWIAQVGEQHSARQLTSGLFNDTSPQWSPDGDAIAFISDRAKPRESSAIYMLSLEGGEAYSVTNPGNKKAIRLFRWSPDGKTIAFLSPDEKSAEQEAKEERKEDAKVYGEHWDFNRLRGLHISTREVFTIFGKDAHVNDFTWNETSTKLSYVLHETPDVNSAMYKGIRIEQIDLYTKSVSPVCEFPGVVRELVWFDDSLYFMAGSVPSTNNSSSTVYRVAFRSGSWSKYAYGTSSCAVGLRRTKYTVMVLVQAGLSDQIRDLFTRVELYGTQQPISLFWDAHSTADKPTIVFAKSSVSCPSEIWSFEADHKLRQLSQHGKAIADLKIADPYAFNCTAKDGTNIDGVMVTPHGAAKSDKYPTIVLIHGGPYDRVNLGFNIPYFYWAPWLVAAGYAVLCPNYRGGKSRGEKFASSARGGVGTDDYDDIIAMIKAGIAQGTIDEERVAIGGWSQGGFLSYLATTRPDFHFRAAVCGAGVTDWDMLTATSDMPSFEAELAGGAPWAMDANSIKARHGSALWHMKDIKTPILILHGEEDVRVPVTQAIAFHRGCLHHGISCEMVTYPREGHMIPGPPERQHFIDMLKRIRRFYDLHLSS